MRELVGRRRKKKVGGEQLEQEARRNGFSRPFNTMRFIGEMRLTIITTDEFSLVPLFRRKTRRWRGGEARFNLTGEDVPLDKCPRTIHLQRNSWPFFSFFFFFLLCARHVTDPIPRVLHLVYEPCISSRPSSFFARRIPADIVSISTRDAASSGRHPPLVIWRGVRRDSSSRHTSPRVMWLSSPARVKFVPFKGEGNRV